VGVNYCWADQLPTCLWLVQTAQALGTRSLFLLGQLCRHAADFIDGAAETGNSNLTLRHCMAIMLAYFRSANGEPRPCRPVHVQPPCGCFCRTQCTVTLGVAQQGPQPRRQLTTAWRYRSLSRASALQQIPSPRRVCCPGGQRVQDGALQALGLLFAARPALMQSPEVAALMRAVLQPSSPAAFKTRLLGSLADLLRASHCFDTLNLLGCLRLRPHSGRVFGVSLLPAGLGRCPCHILAVILLADVSL